MRRVLIADDDSGIRDVLRVVLEGEGYEVVSVADGAQALDFLTRAAIAWIVLLDIQMPCISGLEVCTLLQRAEPDVPRHRIVLMSAGLSPRPALPAGVREFLRKPFNLTELLQLVASVTGEAEDAAGDKSTSTPSQYARDAP